MENLKENKLIDTIIFDLGGVLIDWNPLYVYNNLISDEKEREFFFENICTSDWNEEQDAGRPLQEATNMLVEKFPEHKELIQAYYGRWEEMLGGEISGTVEILKKVRDSGKYRLYALTNWSDENFHNALSRFEFLHWFEGIVVSGKEKSRKPFPEFYQILFDRYKVNPGKAVFIDDNIRIVEGGLVKGLNCIHFQSPQQLHDELLKISIY